MATPRKHWFRASGEWPSGPCVYLAQHVHPYRRSSLWKAGVSRNVKRRLGEFGDVYRLVSYCPCDSESEARALERELHSRIRWPRAGGSREFYRAPVET